MSIFVIPVLWRTSHCAAVRNSHVSVFTGNSPPTPSSWFYCCLRSQQTLVETCSLSVIVWVQAAGLCFLHLELLFLKKQSLDGWWYCWISSWLFLCDKDRNRWFDEQYVDSVRCTGEETVNGKVHDAEWQIKKTAISQLWRNISSFFLLSNQW